jgi:hypothetical protein
MNTIRDELNELKAGYDSILAQVGGGTIAKTDVNNVFSQPQDFQGGSGTLYQTAPIEIQAVNSRIAFHWPGVVASQIGVDTDGTIRTYDNPGTGYAPFKAQAVTAVGNVMVGQNLHNSGGYVYPGRADAAGGYQGSYYLASSMTWGLYTNTSMYFEGGIFPANMTSRGAITTDSITSAKGFRPRVWYSGYAHISPHQDQYDVYHVVDIAGQIIIYNGFCNLDSFPITIILRDNGAAQPITWDSLYMSACGVALPTQTAPSRTLFMGFRFNIQYNKWQMIALAQE